MTKQEWKKKVKEQNRERRANKKDSVLEDIDDLYLKEEKEGVKMK